MRRSESVDVRVLRQFLSGSEPVWPLLLAAVDGLGGSRAVGTSDLVEALLAAEVVPAGVVDRAVGSLSRQALLGSDYVPVELLARVLSCPDVEVWTKVALLGRCWASHPGATADPFPEVRQRYRDALAAAAASSGLREASIAVGFLRRYEVSLPTPERLVDVVRLLAPLPPVVMEVLWTLLDDHLADTWARWRDPFPEIVGRARLLV